MQRIHLKDKEFELFITEAEIQAAVERMAQQIASDMAGKRPLFVGILNGAYELTFARYSSYAGTSSTGILQEVMPISVDVKGRTIILLEDIIDTGFTMSQVMAKLREQGAEEVRLATMLFKPESLKVDLKPDYVGLQIPPAFIVGHGLDYDEMGRAYRDIYQVVE